MKELNIRLNLYAVLKDNIELTEEQAEDLAYKIMDELTKVDLSKDIKEIDKQGLSYQIHMCACREF